MSEERDIDQYEPCRLTAAQLAVAREAAGVQAFSWLEQQFEWSDLHSYLVQVQIRPEALKRIRMAALELELSVSRFQKAVSDSIAVRHGQRSCRSCAYFMSGVSLGEPSICNAFHNMEGRNKAEIADCPDWEARWH